MEDGPYHQTGRDGMTAAERNAMHAPRDNSKVALDKIAQAERRLDQLERNQAKAGTGLQQQGNIISLPTTVQGQSATGTAFTARCITVVGGVLSAVDKTFLTP